MQKTKGNLRKCFVMLLSLVALASVTGGCSKSNEGNEEDKPTSIQEEDDMDTDNDIVDDLSDEPMIEIERISVDENGFDSEGRIVAYFGSPAIDGELDDVWDTAETIKPKHSNVDTTARFKVLWDDNALYFLAEVQDKELSIQSDTPYMQDSAEIFLDENNDKTQEYGVDDLHFRVNYMNSQSVDNGDPERFYTHASEVDGGYIIEARIALKSKPSNGNVMGIELQINDAQGANRVGTINVFDATGNAWNDTSTFGEVLLTGKTPDAITGTNPYDLMSLIKNTLELDFTRYTNSEIISEAIDVAEDVLKKENISQDQIDQQAVAIKDTINKLILTDDAANEKEFVAIPDAYKAEHNNQGSIENLEYSAINLSGGTESKKLNVYLPYGYDATDSSKKYNVFYLMHGGGENENLIFGGSGQSKEMKRVLDNMIANGDIEPLIVVTPTFYGGKNDVVYFPEELINNVIPLVETKYNTYAKSADLSDLKASRDHRAFGGFSMGSVTTWYTYINCLDYIKYFVPLSGDCWAIAQTAGESKAMETAEYLAKVAKDAGYGPEDYYILSATGALDIAYPNMVPQIEAMKKLDDTFIYSADLTKGNFYFLVCDVGTHAWNWVNHYIYDILPDLFSQ